MCERTLGARLGRLTGLLLQQDWSGGDKKFTYKKSTLGKLVEAYLEHSDPRLDAIENLVTDVLPKLVKSEGQLGPVESYPTLTKKTIPFYFAPLIETTAKYFAQLNFTKGALVSATKKESLLHETHKCVLYLEALVVLTKQFASSRPLLASALKHGQLFVGSFLKAFPFFESCFLRNKDKIMNIFKTLQKCTRQLQSVCDGGKELKDLAMIRSIPKMRKNMETLLYRVKALAQMQGCR